MKGAQHPAEAGQSLFQLHVCKHRRLPAASATQAVPPAQHAPAHDWATAQQAPLVHVCPLGQVPAGWAKLHASGVGTRQVPIGEVH